MVMKEISCISEYVKVVCECNDSLIRDGGGHNESLLFRGHADKSYILMPNLGRGRRFATQLSIFNEERNLIEMAKYRMPDVFHDGLNPLELLALLQHYGIPTRLLDVTENALVALYFACCDKPDADGEVFFFKENKTDITNYPIVYAIADSYRFCGTTWQSLSSFYGAVISQPYFNEQRYRIQQCHSNNERGGAWVQECCQKPLFVYASARKMRQQIQQGRYILFPNHITDFAGEQCFEHVIAEMPKDHECIADRIVIPAKAKEKLLADLKVMGIRRDVLFADSVDIVCQEITEEFRKKGIITIYE